jgi:NADH-ubiquinone oxidoreductase chain 4
MFNRIAFAGSINFKYWLEYLPDLNRREFFMLLVLVLFTIILGIYPSIILDGLNYYSYHLLYSADFSFR